MGDIDGMKKIAVLTATRAEYGLLKRLIKKLRLCDKFETDVLVTGMHLSPEFGLTYKEIEEDGIPIAKKIDILLSGDSPVCISKSMGLATIGFAEYFAEHTYDLLIVLGDRYETLAVCIAAMNEKIPIAHLYGGETTEGAVDECIRHAITKMSYLHFTSTEEYRRRVIQLGESPERVFTVGSLGIENILNETLMTREQLEASLDFSLNNPFVIVTLHSTTLENNTSAYQCQNLLNAIDKFPSLQFIFTKANADADGRIINNMLSDFVLEHDNCMLISSLGMRRYLSALKYCLFVMGNSSSGLIEAPSFGIPTINIGERQKGRLRAESVLDCSAEEDVIIEKMKEACEAAKTRKYKNVENPYGDGNTSERIVGEVVKMCSRNKISLKKKFYDLHS